MAFQIKVGNVFRICTVLDASVILICIIMRFVHCPEFYFFGNFLTFCYLHFTVMIVLSEFGIPKYMFRMFPFIGHSVGRGFFILFLSILLFDVIKNLPHPVYKMNLAAAVITLFYSLVYIIYGLMKARKKNDTKSKSCQPEPQKI